MTNTILTLMAAREPIDATPNELNIDDPTIVPIPKLDPVMKVAIKLVNSSGQDVATDIKVAAPTS